jgi:hypothetical protein
LQVVKLAVDRIEALRDLSLHLTCEPLKVEDRSEDEKEQSKVPDSAAPKKRTAAPPTRPKVPMHRLLLDGFVRYLK